MIKHMIGILMLILMQYPLISVAQTSIEYVRNEKNQVTAIRFLNPANGSLVKAVDIAALNPYQFRDLPQLRTYINGLPEYDLADYAGKGSIAKYAGDANPGTYKSAQPSVTMSKAGDNGVALSFVLRLVFQEGGVEETKRWSTLMVLDKLGNKTYELTDVNTDINWPVLSANGRYLGYSHSSMEAHSSIEPDEQVVLFDLSTATKLLEFPYAGSLTPTSFNNLLIFSRLAEGGYEYTLLDENTGNIYQKIFSRERLGLHKTWATDGIVFLGPDNSNVVERFTDTFIKLN